MLLATSFHLFPVAIGDLCLVHSAEGLHQISRPGRLLLVPTERDGCRRFDWTFAHRSHRAIFPNERRRIPRSITSGLYIDHVVILGAFQWDPDGDPRCFVRHDLRMSVLHVHNCSPIHVRTRQPQQCFRYSHVFRRSWHIDWLAVGSVFGRHRRGLLFVRSNI